ncbi:hypothetical protein [Pseudarthrobacter sp. S9]|uniref:hypothetical protein n=1 Tax=Pseudarthrobacter sp. S9 TaxID=3418421 RepID=UPI003CFEE425
MRRRRDSDRRPSRLAEKNTLFIGSEENKMLWALSVPMVVVPRNHERVDTVPVD